MSNELTKEELKELVETLDNNTITSRPNDEDTDSFYKSVLSRLYDNRDIETKTEYLNVNENFIGTKLTFLATYGNMPYLKNFVDIFERKRVSLERKGRKEIIMALGERRQEEQLKQQNAFRNMMGL